MAWVHKLLAEPTLDRVPDSDKDADAVDQGLARLEELVLKALDVLDNRVDAGLRWIAAAQLVDLAGDRLYGYSEFGEWQAAHLARQATAIAVR